MSSADLHIPAIVREGSYYVDWGQGIVLHNSHNTSWGPFLCACLLPHELTNHIRALFRPTVWGKVAQVVKGVSDEEP